MSAAAIVRRIMRISHALSGEYVDSEGLCILVSDKEWDELVAWTQKYGAWRSTPEVLISAFRFAGIEVRKRSAFP